MSHTFDEPVKITVHVVESAFGRKAFTSKAAAKRTSKALDKADIINQQYEVECMAILHECDDYEAEAV